MKIRLFAERGLGWIAYRYVLSWPGGVLLSQSYGSGEACWRALEETLGR